MDAMDVFPIYWHSTDTCVVVCWLKLKSHEKKKYPCKVKIPVRTYWSKTTKHWQFDTSHLWQSQQRRGTSTFLTERNNEHKHGSAKCCFLFVSLLIVAQPTCTYKPGYEVTTFSDSLLCSGPFLKVFVVSGAPPRPGHVNKRLFDRTTTQKKRFCSQNLWDIYTCIPTGSAIVFFLYHI